MPRIVCEVSEKEKEEVKAKADALRIPVAHYIKSLVLDTTSRTLDQHKDLLNAIRALVPTVADGLARTQRLPPEIRQKFAETLLKKWEEER